MRDRGLEPFDVAAHRMREPRAARLELADDVEVQPLAVDLDDHEAGLDRVAGRQVLAGADDQAARRSVGLLAQIGPEPRARSPISDPADDPLRALLQLLLRPRVG